MFGAASSTRWQPRHRHGWQSNLHEVGLDWNLAGGIVITDCSPLCAIIAAGIRL
jgi:hypothetical protein